MPSARRGSAIERKRVTSLGNASSRTPTAGRIANGPGPAYSRASSRTAGTRVRQVCQRDGQLGRSRASALASPSRITTSRAAVEVDGHAAVHHDVAGPASRAAADVQSTPRLPQPSMRGARRVRAPDRRSRARGPSRRATVHRRRALAGKPLGSSGCRMPPAMRGRSALGTGSVMAVLPLSFSGEPVHARRAREPRRSGRPHRTDPRRRRSTAGSTPAAPPRSRSPRSSATRRRSSRRFDADQLFDYRARRPTLEIVDGRLAELTWPELAIRRTRVGERDLLVIAGPEPDDRWQAFCGGDGRARRSARRRGVDQPRRDPRRRAPYPRPCRSSARHRSRAGCAATSSRVRPGAAGPGGDRLRPRDGDGRGGHPGRRLLRPGPALRLGAVPGRVGRAAERARAAPRRRAADGRRSTRRPSSCGPGWTRRRRSRRRPAPMSSGSKRWSTSSACRRATT